MISLKRLLTESEATSNSVTWAKKFQSDLGLTAVAAAAMAANIQWESGFIPNRIQGAGVKTGTMADSGKVGYSWAQWTFGKRKIAFRNYVKQIFGIDINKTSATNDHAYSFLKYELRNPKNTLYDGKKSLNYHYLDLETFKKIKDVNTATQEFVAKYEIAGIPHLADRISLAIEILKYLSPSQSSKSKQTTPYIDVTYSDDNPPYADLLRNPVAERIVSVLKQSPGYFNDYEAWAEAAFMAIKTKVRYDQVKKLLKQDPYAYVKDFMDTSTKYHKQSIDTSYKSLT